MAGILDEHDILNVWGGGQLLAFSGLDGPTDYEGGLCARTDFDGAGLRIVLPGACDIHISEAAPSACRIAGDWFHLQTPEGRTRGAFLDAHHLLIEGPARVRSCSREIAVHQDGPRTLVGAAEAFDPQMISADLDTAIRARRRWLESIALPTGLGPHRRRGLAKALSIMKTQVYEPQGRFRSRWTTPDRWPHRALWLWDSAFHAIGWRHVDPTLARETIDAVFDAQQPDGRVPHMSTPEASSAITQPPVLALAAALIDEVDPDPSWIEHLYPKLCRYVRWDLDQRDSDGHGLLEWFIEGNPDCRSGESGMDNSARFDSAQQLDASDFNAYLAHECEVLADFAHRLNRAQDAAAWSGEHDRLCGLINERLWNDSHGIYMDCVAATGEQAGVLSVAGFVPLICGAPTPEQARRLATHLERGGLFDSPLPVASISPQQSEYYAKDMWRGPVWVNLNWLVAYGFARYGMRDVAAMIREKSLAEIESRYEQYGAFFEYYDDERSVPPPRLLRKGCCDPTQLLHHVIHDYGWTATLYADMALAPAHDS